MLTFCSCLLGWAPGMRWRTQWWRTTSFLKWTRQKAMVSGTQALVRHHAPDLELVHHQLIRYATLLGLGSTPSSYHAIHSTSTIIASSLVADR